MTEQGIQTAPKLLDLGGIELLKDCIGALVPREMPSIVTFGEDTEFCGKNIYPRQQTLLKILYLELENLTDYDHRVIKEWMTSTQAGGDVRIPLDLYERMELLRDRGYTHFGEFVDVGGRRGGKGFIGGLIGSRQTLWATYLDDPQRRFGIDSSKDIYGYVLATTKGQASKYLYADVSHMIESCKALAPYILKSQGEEIRVQTPADKRREARLRVSGIEIERDVASVRIMSSAADASSVRGGAAFFVMLDEFAHFLETGSRKSGSEIYKALRPSLDQMKKDSLMYIPSSPYTETGQFFELVQVGLTPLSHEESQPSFLVFQHPSWELYKDWDKPIAKGHFVVAIQEYDAEMEAEERKDPESFRVERRAQFAKTIDAYLRPEAVEAIFRPYPTTEDVLEQKEYGSLQYTYEAHGDPSKSMANFGFSIGHAEEDSSGLLHVFIDFQNVYMPHLFPPDPETGVRTVNYLTVESDMVEIGRRFPNINFLTFDHWNSVSPIQHIRQGLKKLGSRVRVKEVQFDSRHNYDRCEVFKEAVNMGWVHAPVVLFDHPVLGEINLLEQELKFLQDKGGKVDRQTFGPITTKDLSDCVMEVVYRLLHDQVESLDRGRMSSTHLTPGSPAHRAPESGGRTLRTLQKELGRGRGSSTRANGRRW